MDTILPYVYNIFSRKYSNFLFLALQRRPNNTLYTPQRSATTGTVAAVASVLGPTAAAAAAAAAALSAAATTAAAVSAAAARPGRW